MVETFEIDGDISLVGSAPTLAEASSALPQGSYTTLRTYGGDRVVRLGQHVGRLVESLPGSAPLEERRVARGLAAVLARTRHAESRLRLTYAPPRLFASIEAFEPLPEAAYARGVACVTLRLRRENPHAKDTRFIARASSAYAALPPGVEEGLMVAEDDLVLEGLSSNFFAVAGGVLRTEGERVLPGVTRSVVLEVARSMLPLETRAVAVAELPSLSECFLTSVSREILPVVEIDGRAVGDGRPGPATRALIAGFAALVAREARPLLLSGPPEA